MFDSKYKEQAESLQRTVNSLEKRLDEKDELIKILQVAKSDIAKDFESEKRILNNELHIKIAEEVAKEKEASQVIKEENAVLKKEVEILEKAFENMGFDVKDMKEILNKLVDGVVSKNTIQLVK